MTEKGYIRLLDRYGRTLEMSQEWQIVPGQFDYTVYNDGGIYKAKNERTGTVESTGNDAKQLIQQVNDNLGEGIIFIRKGAYYSNDFSTPLTLSRNIQLIGEGYEITKLYFPVQLGPALNNIIGIAIENPNMDKTGTGLTAPSGDGYILDNVLIAGWEKGFVFATTGSFGDLRIGRLLINSCKYALADGGNYHFYFIADKLEVSDCDAFGHWGPQYSVFNTVNISGTGSTTPSSFGANATVINTLYLEDSSTIYFSDGGYGGFNASTVNKMYVTSSSKAVFGKVVDNSYINHLVVDNTSTVELWVDKINIRFPDGVEGTLSFKAGNPKVFGLENNSVASIVGDGTTTTFTVDVQHMLNIDDISKIAVTITPSKPASISYTFVDTDSDGFNETLRIQLIFSSAPASGEVIYISWRAVEVYS